MRLGRCGPSDRSGETTKGQPWMLRRSSRDSVHLPTIVLFTLALLVVSCGDDDATVDDEPTEQGPSSSGEIGTETDASDDGGSVGETADGGNDPETPRDVEPEETEPEGSGLVSIALDGTDLDPGAGDPECTVGLTGGPSKFEFDGDAAKLNVDYDTDAAALSRVALQVDRGDGDWDIYRQADGALEAATAELNETHLQGEVILTPVTTSTDPSDVEMAFEIAC